MNNNHQGIKTPPMEILEVSQLVQAPLCPICGGQSKSLLRMPTINPNSEERVALRECLVCRHWWHDPLVRQEYLSKLYKNDSAFVLSLIRLSKLNPPSENDIKKFAKPILMDFSNGKKFNFLEIGSASGEVLKYFSTFAQTAYGVEPAPREESPNVVADIDLLPADVKFDCVVIQDVLEHLTDPIGMLKKIRSRVNPEARIYAGFPNKDSLKARLMKNKWSMVRPVGHLHYFSSRSVDLMFKNAGWKIVNSRAARIGDLNAKEVILGFDYKGWNLPFRLLKSLLLGQLFMGKDQWKVVGQAE